jgi:mycoredoxin
MMPEKIILYGHNICPMLGPTMAMLKQAKVEYDYINIHKDKRADERVREINKGYASVPTLVFADGSTLTEPSAIALKRKLTTEGYHVPFMALAIGNAFPILIGAAIVISVLSALGVV